MAGLVNHDEMFDLRMSEGAKALFEQVKTFVSKEVEPVTMEFHRLGEAREDRWDWGEGQLELLDGVKAKAKAAGLWNFFLPDDETGQGRGERRHLEGNWRDLGGICGASGRIWRHLGRLAS